MSSMDAAWAIREAMEVCEEAEDMIAAGAVGDMLRETLKHAAELVDVADEELQVATFHTTQRWQQRRSDFTRSSVCCATHSTNHRAGPSFARRRVA
jgi:hypothetical protein